jgi:hypothetical protein
VATAVTRRGGFMISEQTTAPVAAISSGAASAHPGVFEPLHPQLCRSHVPPDYLCQIVILQLL